MHKFVDKYFLLFHFDGKDAFIQVDHLRYLFFNLSLHVYIKHIS